MPKIDKTYMDKLEINPEKEAFHWDSEVKGFGIKVTPAGGISFVFQYRTRQGRSRRYTIGRYSTTLTADRARKLAKEARHAVEDALDPQGDKQAQRKASTLADLFDQYLESEKFAEKAESTRAVDLGRINGHLRPALGRTFVDQLTAEDVRRAFNQIRDGKTASDTKTGPRGRSIVKGGEGTARKSVQLLRAILRWGGFKDASNPAAEVNVGSDGERTAVLESADDYAKLFRTLDTMQDQKRITAAHADAIRIIALTGARRGEIAGLQWQHVDLAKGLITLPPSRHKTGRKTGKARIIGLPTAAVEIITRQTAGEPGDFVFQPTRGDGGSITLSHIWAKVRKEAGLPDDIVLHSLRHSLASHMAISGAQAAEIMAALGHRQMSTAQKYVHWAESAHKQLAERSSAHIAAAMNTAPKPTAKHKLRVVK